MRPPTDNALVFGNLREYSAKHYILWATFCRRKYRCVFKPLLHNEPRKLPNSVK